ncbi:MAG: hypothetical protein L6U99_13605 [Clostridium sp.]|nr:MAG: hypothetical protein L6U99_13605 [Clostridium sp.]
MIKIHSLKGITLNLGAENLYYCSQQILDSIKKGEDFDLQAFKYCFNMTYNELKDFCRRKINLSSPSR